MRFSYLVFFHDDTKQGAIVSERDVASVRGLLREISGLSAANLYRPAMAKDMFDHGDASPVFGIQLYFAELASMEAALAPAGRLQGLMGSDMLSSLCGMAGTQQAMCVRQFPVADAELRTPKGELPCSYLVHYPGPAEDLPAWLGHYIAHHQPLMHDFPAIRWIEILSRIDWCGGLALKRVDYMLRNRVMFDSPLALTQALHAPARIAMRDDSKMFPSFEGGNRHFPMTTEAVPTSG